MTTIVLPDHQLIRHPTIIANRKVPIFYADGGFSRHAGEMMRIIFYQCPQAERPGREALIVMMPRSGFEMSMVLGVTEFFPDAGREFTQH